MNLFAAGTSVFLLQSTLMSILYIPSNSDLVDWPSCANQSANNLTYPNCKLKFEEYQNIDKIRRNFSPQCIRPSVFLVPHNLTLPFDFDEKLPHRYLKINCTAPFPMNFQYEGSGFLDYLHIWKRIKFPDVNSTVGTTTFTTGVEIRLTSAATGRYIIHSVDHPEIQNSYFVFTSKAKKPFLVRVGETLHAKFRNNPESTILPCITPFWNTTVNLFKASSVPAKWEIFNGTETTQIKYNPEQGYILPRHVRVRADDMFKCTTGGIDDPDSVIVEIPSASNSSTLETPGIPSLKIEFSENGKTALCCGGNEQNSSPIRFYNAQSNNPTVSPYLAECLTRGRAYCGLYRNKDLKRGKSIDGLASKNGSTNTTTSTRTSCSRIENIHANGILVCVTGKQHGTFKEYFRGRDNKIYTDWKMAPKHALIRPNYTGALPRGHESHRYKFKCDSVKLVLVNDWIVLSARLNNGTIVKLTHMMSYDVWRGFLPPDTADVFCSDQLWTTHEVINSSIRISDYSEHFPEVIGEDNFHFAENSLAELVCEAKALPAELLHILEWWWKGKQITDEARLRSSPTGTKLDLLFPSVKAAEAGVYTCVAQNMLARVNKSFTVNVIGKPDSAGLYYVLVPVALVVFTALGVAVFLVYQNRRLKRVLKDSEVKAFLKGATNEELDEKNEISNLPYNAKYEVRKRQIKINTSEVLGSGEFGLVYRGHVVSADSLEIVPVAVKTVKDSSNATQVKSLLNELKVISYLDNGHRNILHIIGAYTEKIQNGEIYVCVELCQSNMLSILQTHQLHKSARTGNDAELPENRDNTRISMSKGNSPTLIDMLRWAYQIADGMEFLCEKRVIHGDLATRNILISMEFAEVKIADFGLGRILENHQYIMGTAVENMPLPWRWMAIEALTDKRFSSASDVWAFGVTLWEVFSMGEVPYPALLWSLDFLQDLKNGLRLNRPEYATDQLYSLLESCWNPNAKERPNFTEIKNAIASIRYPKTVDENEFPIGHAAR